MRDGEYETTIGTGGWVLVGFSGLITFGVLRGLAHEHLFPSVVFAIAIALIVLLVLYWLASKVDRDDDQARQVRKIVPASGEVRMNDSGAGAAVKAVPVRPEALKAQRPSSVVTPLTEVESAPIIPSTPMPAAAVMAELDDAPVAPVPAPKAKVAKPKAEPKAKAAAKPKADPKPKAEPAVAPKGEKATAPKTAKPKAEKTVKPAGLLRLKAPRKGKADDLKEIEGIGPALEKMVNGLGFFHFDQIAAWTDADVALVDAEMKTFKGRISRDKWVTQARIIVSDGLEAFRERAKTNDY